MVVTDNSAQTDTEVFPFEAAFVANDFSKMLAMYPHIRFVFGEPEHEWVSHCTDIGWTGVCDWQNMATTVMYRAEMRKAKDTTCALECQCEGELHRLTETIPFVDAHATGMLMRRLAKKVGRRYQ